MTDFFGILAAGPAFFVSAWLLMIFAGITAADVGIRPFSYLTAMVVTIGLWLVGPRQLARSRGRLDRRKRNKGTESFRICASLVARPGLITERACLGSGGSGRIGVARVTFSQDDEYAARSWDRHVTSATVY